MLLSSVIIILREVLEAALLFSILFSLSRQFKLQQNWILWSITFGLIGSAAYAININSVTDWFDGVGQEVSNAFIQVGIYFLILLYMLMLIWFQDQKNLIKRLLIFFMVAISSLAITREGSEIILYFFSVTRSQNHYMTVLIGMTIGASIGISIGFLFYYVLCNMKSKWSILIGLALLTLVAAGMVSQASLLLIQADWLPAQLPLWDTSDWLSERSASGQLLYALIGYEATPTAIQAGLYLAGLVIPLILMMVLYHKLGKKHYPSIDIQEQ